MLCDLVVFGPQMVCNILSVGSAPTCFSANDRYAVVSVFRFVDDACNRLLALSGLQVRTDYSPVAVRNKNARRKKKVLASPRSRLEGCNC